MLSLSRRTTQNMIMVSLLAGAFWTLPARAELDPELAGANSKNEGGLFITGKVGFGQAYATGGSSPGLAMKLGVEPGLVLTRDSWGRLEGSLEVATSRLSFTRDSSPKQDITMQMPLTLLAKFGYGYSLGYSSFAVWRLGLGPAISTFEGESAGVDFESDGTLMGLQAMVGMDFVTAIGSAMDFVGGFALTHYQFNVQDVKVGGTKVDYDEPVNLNVPELHAGLRLTF